MTSHTSRFFAPLLATSLAALAACAGGQTQQQPTGPTPVVVQPPSGGTDSGAGGAGSPPAAPAITKPGPNVTPDGVVFNHREAGKHDIFLAGNFNNWNPSDPQFKMKDDDGDGVWSITIKLAPGTYQYKYVIDGKWTQDQYAPGDAPDGFGGRNSQFDVK